MHFKFVVNNFFKFFEVYNMDMFCQRFKELKLSKKVTYQQIADILNVKMRTVQYYVSGHLKPEYYGLIALADYFNVSLDYLVGRSDNPKINK